MTGQEVKTVSAIANKVAILLDWEECYISKIFPPLKLQYIDLFNLIRGSLK